VLGLRTAIDARWHALWQTTTISLAALRDDRIGCAMRVQRRDRRRRKLSSFTSEGCPALKSGKIVRRLTRSTAGQAYLARRLCAAEVRQLLQGANKRQSEIIPL
jgi:hypothetical protein